MHFVDQTDTAAVLTAAQDADLVWVETPSNPLLQIADIAAIAEGLAETTLLVVDGTFTTPLLQQPLALGADLVVHSATKLIGGHADLLMGVAIGSDELATRLRDHRYAYGATPGSLEAYLSRCAGCERSLSASSGRRPTRRPSPSSSPTRTT